MIRMLGIGLIAGWIMHDIYDSDKEKVIDVIKMITEKKVVDNGKDKDKNFCTDGQAVHGD